MCRLAHVGRSGVDADYSANKVLTAYPLFQCELTSSRNYVKTHVRFVAILRMVI